MSFANTQSPRPIYWIAAGWTSLRKNISKAHRHSLALRAKGGYANHVGSEYAPEPVPLQQQHQPAFPQLLAAPWDQHIGFFCNVVMKNKFEALSVDDEKSERKDKDNLERVVAACIEDPDIPWKKVTKQNRRRATKRQHVSLQGSTRQQETRYISDSTNDLECLVTSSNVDMNCMDNLDTRNWEQISFMVDSGASETVACSNKFIGYDTVETTATCTEYSSAGSGGAVIKNAGEKRIEVITAKCVESYIKVQMCDLGLSLMIPSAGHTCRTRAQE